MRRTENTILYVILVIAMATWGLSWTNGKLLAGYTTVPVLMIWRFFIAALAMLIVLLARKSIIKISSRGALQVIASSAFLVSYNYFYFNGTQVGAAGAGGVLVTTLNPILTVILISIVNQRLPQLRSTIGIILGLIGGSIIINVWQNGWSAVFATGNQYFVMCAFSWTFLTLISSGITKHMSSLTYSFWTYLCAGVIALFFVGDGDLLEVLSFDFVFWINLFAVSVGAMAFATTAYFIASSKLGSEKASAFILTVPLSAMLFSMLILNEPLKLNVILGGSLSILAVYLINSVKLTLAKSNPDIN